MSPSLMLKTCKIGDNGYNFCRQNGHYKRLTLIIPDKKKDEFANHSDMRFMMSRLICVYTVCPRGYLILYTILSFDQTPVSEIYKADIKIYFAHLYILFRIAVYININITIKPFYGGGGGGGREQTKI